MAAFVAPAHAETANAKRIALTFDDGPTGDGPFLNGDERTALLIETLKSAGVEQAAFLVTTRGLSTEEGRKRIMAYADAGHVIGNHSHTHQWAHKMETEAYLADIDAAEARLEGFANRRPWYRFPYLDEGRTLEKRDALRAGLKERGLISAYVTVDTYDWHLVNLAREAVKAGQCMDREKAGALYTELFVSAAEHYHALALETLGRAPVQNMLLHENDFAALFVDDLVAGLRAAGWEIVSADDAFADPVTDQLPETIFSGKGRIAAFAYEAGARGAALDHPSSDAGALDARVEQAGIFAVCEAE